MTRRARSRMMYLLLLLAAEGLLLQAPTRPHLLAAPMAATAAAPTSAGWLDVDYSPLVDRRRLTHSGESVGALLQRLEGRPYPSAGERPDDATAHVLLGPLLEPYAFVLSDVLDAAGPSSAVAGPSSAATGPLVEIGQLWQPGESQPAWAELLRSRHFLVESDGAGRFRVCLPWAPSANGDGRAGASGAREGAGASGTSGAREGAAPAARSVAEASPPSIDSAQAAREAWDAAWPILRHVFAAEKRRLARAGGDAPGAHTLQVDVHPYVHVQARTLFRLGMRPYHVSVRETTPRGTGPGLDLQAWQSFLDHGLQLEGGRVEPDGTIRLLGSDLPAKPTLLGRPLQLSDFAVAYRAVFHGGLGEPYMSLDRGSSPQTSLVNYGGRLQDTSLGLVSLLCDIRFKTFSLGIDILANRDMRERVRQEVPSFRTHMERFAGDARSKGVLTQQTRLWFYPDSVDLTLSPEGDVLVMRRVRMSAASERVQQETFTAKREPDPPWTAATVSAINADYDALGRIFPELADLDQVVRLLSFFTWLRQVDADEGVLADLDVLLALDLPAQPTPRRFPQLLAFSLVPPSGGEGPVEVVNRVSVGEALDRLQPPNGIDLPASRRYARALGALDPGVPDQAGLARELQSYDVKTLDETALDLLAYRAERLRMHRLVLNTLPADVQAQVQKRKSETEGVRSMSTGIGGLDLGMSRALARASGRTAGSAAASGAEGSTRPGARPEGRAASTSAGAAPRTDPRQLPATEIPDHGYASPAQGAGNAAGKPAAPAAEGLKEYRGHWSGTGGAQGTSWTQTIMGANGPDPRLRRTIQSSGAPGRTFERLEDLRFLRYRIGFQGPLARVELVDQGLPAALALRAADPRGLLSASGEPAGAAPPRPAGLASLAVESSAARPDGAGDTTEGAESPTPPAPAIPAATTASAESPTLRLTLSGVGGRDLQATIPRGILQRAVVGRDTDLTSDRPLAGLSPASKILGETRNVMVMMQPAEIRPPWTEPDPPRPGEESAARIATGLGRWWQAEIPTAAPHTGVGTDPVRSFGRWAQPHPLTGSAPLVLVPETFPSVTRGLRDRLAAAWRAGPAGAGSAPAEGASALVVVVSAEAPGVLGDRLREMAKSTAMRGKLLAVWSLGGPIRSDLPASLLAEGNLAGIAIADESPLASARVENELQALSAALQAPGLGQKRPEDLPVPLTWFY